MNRKRWLIWALVFITLLYLTMQLNAIGIVHDYYFFPFVPWIFMLIALGAKGIMRLPKWGNTLSIILLACAWIFTPNFTKDWREWKNVYYNQKQYLENHREELKSLVPRDELCVMLNDNSSYILPYFIDQQGHTFRDDNFQIEWIPDIVENYGAHYLFSDSEQLNRNPAMEQYVEQVLFEKGGMKVFKLKNPKNIPAKTVMSSIQEEAKK